MVVIFGFFQVDAVSSEPPKKKIRIQAKSSRKSIQNLIKRLELSSSSNEVLLILAEISDSPNIEDITPEAIRFLVSLFRKEKDFVRVKILYLFCDFVLDHGIDASLLIEEVLLLIKMEESSKVINQAFTTLFRIGQLGQTQDKVPQALLSKIVEFAKFKLTSTNHNVQRHAIQLIGAFASREDAERELMALISFYMDSSDARVRAQAMNSLLCMSSRGIELLPSLYLRAEKALKDDYECGRKEALQLIFVLSQRHPEFLIKISDSMTEIRLIDDAFAKICSGISDISMQIRAFAGKLSLQNVISLIPTKSHLQLSFSAECGK